VTPDPKGIIRKAANELIDEVASDRDLQRSWAKHVEKIHFVPVQYRVFGGLLQSLNIKFGNFIEVLISLVVEADPLVNAHPVSRTKPLLSFSPETDRLIDAYITMRQQPTSSDLCDEDFRLLVDQIFANERTERLPKSTVTKDIDALFQTSSGEMVYLEIKYNDDHDTGKFQDINRKFLKTYAGLVNLLEIDDPTKLTPILYYFNPVKRWGPIYVPSSNILRGRQLFDKYFAMDFTDVDSGLREISNDQLVLAKFDDLYRRIREKSQNPPLASMELPDTEGQ
jgi:hypothetical protein